MYTVPSGPRAAEEKMAYSVNPLLKVQCFAPVAALRMYTRPSFPPMTSRPPPSRAGAFSKPPVFPVLPLEKVHRTRGCCSPAAGRPDLRGDGADEHAPVVRSARRPGA
jgi:hypothetical protein